MNLEQKIEGFLFYKAEPVEFTELASIFSVSKEEVMEAVNTLATHLEGRGITLIRTATEVTLGTIPELSELLEKIKKEELSKDLSKASIETLAIVLYRDGVTRGEIDYIRGVNSSFILRMLSVRNLVKRVQHPNDSRAYIYKPTIDVLRFLGINSVQELPEYEATVQTLSSAFSQTETKEE